MLEVNQKLPQEIYCLNGTKTLNYYQKNNEKIINFILELS